MTNKFIAVKKERDQYNKDNKELQNDILIMQSNIRQMIPGFSNNTSSSFPMLNEIQNKLSEFFKCDCQDVFFDLLLPELNIEGIVFFFKTSFSKIQELINNYFEPMETQLKKTLCIDNLWSPIDNVLRKSIQSNWKKIFIQTINEIELNNIMLFIQNNLKLQDEDITANKAILDFLRKSAEIIFIAHVSDPPTLVDINAIGQKINFNSIKHDSVDGFIKQKNDCVVILPPCYKVIASNVNSNNIGGNIGNVDKIGNGINSLNNENLILKAQVLPNDYEFP
jgi:hypothetical protein